MIRNTNKRIVRPTHPGEFLREDFLRELDLWEAERRYKAELKQIKPATAA